MIDGGTEQVINKQKYKSHNSQPPRLARHAKVLSADVRMFHKWSEETSVAPSEEEEEEEEGVQVASSQDGADLMAPTHEN